jgi:hypothetical protein
MRKNFLLAAGFALAITPALAADFQDYPPIQGPVYAPQSLVTGHVEIMGGMVSFEGESYGAVAGAGRASVPLHGIFKLELEVTGSSLFDDGESMSAFGGFAHLYGEGDHHALGVFGGYVGFSNLAGFALGAEGNFGFGSSVLFGQAAYILNQQVDNILFLRGGLHHYFSMDTRGTIDLAWVNSPAFDSAWSATGSVEHRFTGTPWSLFASLGVSGASGTDIRPWTAMVGARLFVDQPGSTLASHDKAVPFNVRLPVLSLGPT